MSRDRDVEEALRQPDAVRLGALNRKLEDLVAGTQASVLYVLDRRGVAIASSNWREPSSFVGSDYAFRAYFTQAVFTGTAEHFALGNVSLRPGLYISHRIGPAENPLGVVVVKAEFDQMEGDWRDSERPSYVVDQDGVVLITSIPSWRFMTVPGSSPERLVAVRRSLQFGEAPLLSLPISNVQRIDDDTLLMNAVLPGTRQSGFIEVSSKVPSTPWTLHYLLPVEPAQSSSVREAQLTALSALLPLLALFATWIWRRQATISRTAAEQAAREELERRVAERTDDLSRARDRLQAEIIDHRATEERLQGVQHELVQANRLAILAQVAAGVAHEINQPVATIRAYADNARTFLERNRTSEAEENLKDIARLTERIGVITDDLKILARKGRGVTQPVGIKAVIEGAVLLLRSRFSGHLDALDIRFPPDDLNVLGSPIRLEQIIINLLQNALEAVASQPDQKIEVRVRIEGEDVVVSITDNGPGIAPQISDALFTPFNTSKEGGLGLGLVISREIAADYGGRIDVKSSAAGTCFSVYLRKA
jgi:two-component system C4-dicarboxylate transport sensor histidine kinase DctB